jgi:hypothetical protein
MTWPARGLLLSSLSDCISGRCHSLNRFDPAESWSVRRVELVRTRDDVSNCTSCNPLGFLALRACANTAIPCVTRL